MSKVGAIRIGARSYREYALGWSSKCRGLRWLPLQRDLDETNITSLPGADVMPEQLRATMHLPVWQIVDLALAVVSLQELGLYFALR